ncbi:ankyrin repeat domain-containing protein [Roseovarius phycicola]|uniref:Ankyrin repeat domain-containing protein n=1 Tax=Roseovarius phycicola TaxID=3080976 RepID=A0ABZ2HL53_9RHOB
MSADYPDIHELIWKDDLDGLTRILDQNPDVAKDTDVMIYAVQAGSPEIIGLMISRGAPVRIEVDDGFPLLHIAVDRPRDPLPGKAAFNHDALTVLLKAGADVNERGMNDWTPLHRAAAIGDLEACCILMEHGADRSARTQIDHHATPEEEARHLGEYAAADFVRDYEPKKH